jgi:predicted Rossmann fold flavoprotein
MTAAARGRRVVVLDRSNKIGKKILMSGGGRCNFTNVHTEAANFLSENPHYCVSALSRYTPWDFIALVDKHEIKHHEKTLGQLFCDDSSKQIVKLLTDECAAAGVEIVTHCETSEVVVEMDATKKRCYLLATNKGQYGAESLVVATGGLSIPKMGASDFGYRVARQFELNVIETRAALVPFTFTGDAHEMMARLSGISATCAVTCNGHTFREDLLFTHRGLSGPAILQISSFWKPGDDILVSLLPDVDLAEVLLAAKRGDVKNVLRNFLSEHLPRALVLELEALFFPDIANTALRQVADERLRGIAAKLQAWSLRPAATEGYRTAEVTLGGVDTRELSSRTMECRAQPGLYFIGEVVDVTGHLGGFNFQWAWASGRAAGLVA